jgi:hypothetical protein
MPKERRAKGGDRQAVDNRNYVGVQGVLRRVQRLGLGQVLRERAGLNWVFGMVGMLFDLGFLLYNALGVGFMCKDGPDAVIFLGRPCGTMGRTCGTHRMALDGAFGTLCFFEISSKICACTDLLSTRRGILLSAALRH